MASFSIVIQNKKGLHARAAALFVKEIERFQSEVWVSFGGQKVSARSIMGLMMYRSPSKNSWTGFIVAKSPRKNRFIIVVSTRSSM